MVGRILALDPAARRREEAALSERFPALPGLAAARTVLLYVTAFPEEIATGELLARVLEQGKRLICPRVHRSEGRLALFAVEDPRRDLIPGTRGIPEPAGEGPEVAPREVDWLLVPGLAFNMEGYRLGRGAGHYDRLLPQLRSDAPRWALIYDCQWVDDLPVEPHDVPLDGIVSPGREIGPSLRDRTG
jgi:5-formyltetrahydrofolate cyclo-ligase